VAHKKTSLELLSTTPIISGMVNAEQVELILDLLEEVLESGIDGDVVELGCNTGTTSIFIRKMLDLWESDKVYHVYDSFEGLPEKSKQDTGGGNAGECRTTRETFEGVFSHFNLHLPVVNEGWFANIPDDRYPDKICFAFFDGDFYTSIIDSFEKTYHKLQSGCVVVLHDYGAGLPGVKAACSEFLSDKPESVIQAIPGVGYFIKE